MKWLVLIGVILIIVLTGIYAAESIRYANNTIKACKNIRNKNCFKR